MDNEWVLTTSGLTKKYGTATVVDNVDMHIRRGDIYGFVGENGAGKTTLIRMLSGLSCPTSGTYSLFGVPSNDKSVNKARRRMAAIVETVSLNKTLTAKENLRLQCLIVGAKKTDEELDALLEQVGLNHETIAKKKAGAFSLGMRQRLGIAIALLGEPEFLLLDEPMNGLDPQGFIDMRETILSLHSRGVTFLISSHILSELEKVCTCVGFIHQGKLLQEISMEELHQKSRKNVEIRAENVAELASFLSETLHLSAVEREEEKLRIYDEVDINALMETLVQRHRHILSLSVVEESIEDYYAKLMTKEAQR